MTNKYELKICVENVKKDTNKWKRIIFDSQKCQKKEHFINRVEKYEGTKGVPNLALVTDMMSLTTDTLNLFSRPTRLSSMYISIYREI